MQGLSISLIGICITFSTLGLFILLMIVLQRIFPVKRDPVQEAGTQMETFVEIEIDQESSPGNEDQAIAAAIAVAINYFRAVNQPALGATLEAGRGRWWSANQLSARQVNSLKKN